MATGTETSKVSPALRLGGMTTFMSWPLMLYWTVSPGDLRIDARLPRLLASARSKNSVIQLIY